MDCGPPLDPCLEEAAELPVYDLSDRMALAELLELLQGEKADPASNAALSPAFSFLLSDGALDLYRLGETLYYYDPAGLQLMRCGCEEAALFSALGI